MTMSLVQKGKDNGREITTHFTWKNQVSGPQKYTENVLQILQSLGGGYSPPWPFSFAVPVRGTDTSKLS